MNKIGHVDDQKNKMIYTQQSLIKQIGNNQNHN